MFDPTRLPRALTIRFSERRTESAEPDYAWSCLNVPFGDRMITGITSK